MHHILVAYWQAYESANRVLIHKVQCTCCVDNFMKFSDSGGTITSQLNAVFISWYTFSTVHKWPLPCYAQAQKQQSDLKKWVLLMATTASVHVPYHILIRVSALVLKHVCHSVSCKAPQDIVLHTAEHIDSFSSLVCRCQLLIHRFPTCLIAALSVAFLGKSQWIKYKTCPWNNEFLTCLVTVYSTGCNGRIIYTEGFSCIVWSLWSLSEGFS